MISDDDLYAKRTIRQLSEYIQNVKTAVNKDKNEKAKANLKKGNYKKFLEELIPLLIYGKEKYGIDSSNYFQLIKGNQAYDAIISDKYSEIEIVEITFPIDGKEENIDAKVLNNRGYGKIRLLDDFGQNEVKRRILEKAKDKSLKNYIGKTLIIILDPYPFFEMDDEDDLLVIGEIAEELKKIKYSANCVYLIVLPITTNSKVYNSFLIAIK